MPSLLVPSDFAAPIRRQKGIQLTIINQSAVDAYVDDDANRLNNKGPGSIPEGTKIANGGGQIQISDFKGLIWIRAATPTQVEVQP